jgi:magnesium transporter
MIDILYRNASGAIVKGEPAALPEILRQCHTTPSAMLWVDLIDGAEKGTDPEIAQVLSQVFKFHPLSIEDALEETSTPRLDDWGHYLYVVLHGVHYSADDEQLHTHELDIFIGKDYIVTHRWEKIAAVEHVKGNVLRDQRHTQRGPDYVLYELCDQLAADYMPVLESLDGELDDLEGAVFDARRIRGRLPTAQIFRIKRKVLALRRILSPQREVINKLARDPHPAIDPKEQIYFRDAYDHFVRLHELTENMRDVTAGTLDTYLSVAANRTNDVMKALTLVTVIFAPLSFITGFWGMNFFGASYELDLGVPRALLFVLMLLSIAAVPVGLLLLFKKRGWW